MPKRTYKKYGEVYLDLERFCRKRLKNGSSFLPPERELAQSLGTSVMTLRKAIERGRIEGMLMRQGRRMAISLPDRTLYGFGKILFVEQGFYGKPVLGAINRLYQELALRMLSLKADFEFYQLNAETDLNGFERACERASALMFGLLTTDRELNLKAVEIMKRQEAAHKPVIALSDPNLGLFENYCALDNFAVGVKAAETLFAAGCRRPGFIGSCSGQIFLKRLKGMEETCRSNGVELCNFSLDDRRHLHVLRTGLESAVRTGCDGVFIVTDEGIKPLLHDHLENGFIPEKLKVLTLHGSGESLICQPPVACINHATDKVADALIDFLLAFAGNPALPPLQRLIVPDLYPSVTLGKDFKIK
ncbi:MAG: GntR family transcriptional regulator [Lentisphaeria bacterium]|nr:GntR family transcriptional regulator [Lentisphaeria bacterium]